jgi:hypothetical protein
MYYGPGYRQPDRYNVAASFLIFVHTSLDERLYLYDLLSPIDR